MVNNNSAWTQVGNHLEAIPVAVDGQPFINSYKRIKGNFLKLIVPNREQYLPTACVIIMVLSRVESTGLDDPETLELIAAMQLHFKNFPFFAAEIYYDFELADLEARSKMKYDNVGTPIGEGEVSSSAATIFERNIKDICTILSNEGFLYGGRVSYKNPNEAEILFKNSIELYRSVIRDRGL